MIRRRAFLALLAGAAVWPAHAIEDDGILQMKRVLNRLRAAINGATAEEIVANKEEIRRVVYGHLPEALDAGIDAFQRSVTWRTFDLFTLTESQQEALVSSMAFYLPGVVTTTFTSRFDTINEADFFAALMGCASQIKSQAMSFALSLGSDARSIHIEKANLLLHLGRFEMIFGYLDLLRARA